MTDDLDDLKSALNAATPAPDAARKAENLALAQKNYADLQGSRDGARPTSDRPVPGLWRGVLTMVNALTSRGGLVATTALVVITSSTPLVIIIIVVVVTASISTSLLVMDLRR